MESSLEDRCWANGWRTTRTCFLLSLSLCIRIIKLYIIKIVQTIQKFNLHSLENFNDLGQSETTQSDSEFDFDSQNESFFESDSEEIISDLENSDSQGYEDEKE